MRTAQRLALTALLLAGLAPAAAHADAATDRHRYGLAARSAIYRNLGGPGPTVLIERGGRAVVKFRIDRAGGIGSMRAGKSNGDPLFEATAMSLVRRAAPAIPPMPASVPGEGMDFSILIGINAAP